MHSPLASRTPFQAGSAESLLSGKKTALPSRQLGRARPNEHFIPRGGVEPFFNAPELGLRPLQIRATACPETNVYNVPNHSVFAYVLFVYAIMVTVPILGIFVSCLYRGMSSEVACLFSPATHAVATLFLMVPTIGWYCSIRHSLSTRVRVIYHLIVTVSWLLPFAAFAIAAFILMT